jgi:hypothetical protein
MPKIPHDEFDESRMFGHATSPREALEGHDMDIVDVTRVISASNKKNHLYAPQEAPSAMNAAPPVGKPMSGNPLAGYFRMPGLTAVLPTGGAFFHSGGFEVREGGEIVVFPMTGADELLLSSPDALMNNTAITSLISSCVPQIKIPDQVTIPDLDVILLAIRVASSGDTMKVDLQCEQCEHHTSFHLSIPGILSTAKTVQAKNIVRVNDTMVAEVMPYTISTHTKMLNAAFVQTRKAQSLEQQEGLSDERKNLLYGEIMRELAEITNAALADSIVAITVPNATVVDKEHILEFLQKTDRNILNVIKKKVEELNSSGVDKTFLATCSNEECGHEWTAEVEFDPTSFFEERS